MIAFLHQGSALDVMAEKTSLERNMKSPCVIARRNKIAWMGKEILRKWFIILINVYLQVH